MLFRSRVIQRTDRKTTVYQSKLTAEIPNSLLSQEYKRFCEFMDREKLLCIVREIVSGVMNEDELTTLRIHLDNAFADVCARANAVCRLITHPPKHHIELLYQHLSLLESAIHQKQINYAKLSAQYFAVNQVVGDILSDKQLNIHFDSMNNLDETVNQEVHQSCALL